MRTLFGSVRFDVLVNWFVWRTHGCKSRLDSVVVCTFPSSGVLLLLCSESCKLLLWYDVCIGCGCPSSAIRACSVKIHFLAYGFVQHTKDTHMHIMYSHSPCGLCFALDCSIECWHHGAHDHANSCYRVWLPVLITLPERTSR